jgi:acyl-CoA synthetase (AMP-forming)/AMP-acid ligase II
MSEPGEGLLTLEDASAIGDERDGLREHFAEWTGDDLVCCGVVDPQITVSIRDDQGKPVPDGKCGEIVVAGPCVAQGIVGRGGQIVASLDGLVRTGDLGLIHGGRLYLCGRLKDVIVSRGRNVPAHTIEWAASTVPGVRPGCVAAFAVPGATGEDLVVVVEADADEPVPDLIQSVRARVTANCGIQARDVLVAVRGSVSKTTSGKFRRRLIRDRYLRGEIEVEMLPGDFGACSS